MSINVRKYKYETDEPKLYTFKLKIFYVFPQVEGSLAILNTIEIVSLSVDNLTNEARAERSCRV